MATEITIQEEPKPPLVRIWYIVINNGIDRPVALPDWTQAVMEAHTIPFIDSYGEPSTRVEYTEISPAYISGYHTEFEVEPFVELWIRGVWPLMNPLTNTQLNNPIGQPAYINSNYVATIILPLSELTSYIALWENMMAISYTKVEERAAGAMIKWTKM